MKLERVIDQPVIEAGRFILRPLRRSDAGLLELYAGDRRVACNTTTIPHPLPPGAAENFIDRAQADDRTEDIWALDGSLSGLSELMGVVGLERMDRDQSEIGYWVVPALWNTGMASEAVEAIVAANPQGARTLFGSVFQDNPASAKVLTHAGFEYIGDAEAFSVARQAKVATWTYLRRLER
ncbi:GNAT family N-acetyltransferase [Psychromarinibacter sp. C21-152]|uniref:GNAT family N-acetyltransferase n=1 Tax=Psychromarinibacter sediminicola TaxID=3033385 RepID=A0AAE3NQF4_9RHOB|nr:GNAT family N-acetyltransferase [Psychromarinibacter sediminicola]MDF0600544.1 GNAT family N-acetyltransferase [Psychromarinibacter sediminicola]